MKRAEFLTIDGVNVVMLTTLQAFMDCARKLRDHEFTALPKLVTHVVLRRIRYGELKARLGSWHGQTSVA